MATPRRIARLAQVLHRRQPEILLALDGVHDPHNLSAILRSADATGLTRILWQPDQEDPDPPNPEVAMGTERWVALEAVPNLREAILALKGNGYRVAATHLAADAVDFRQVDWTGSWIIVLGNEHRGCTDEILSVTDVNIVLPMMGFVQSLNVSVAAAVLLYEVQRQRAAAGLYQRTLPTETVRTLYERWGLANDGISCDDLLVPPASLPPSEQGHTDGRHKGKGRPKRQRGSG
ncbi:MAG: tRNA (guanosine(18)-2'-O)-methyltransferase [Candidatus Ozemobacter sibiricus]|jgi:tRNA (guanosine-2'-O-)-methyltransferase|uniref:tRNA (guanosine(18)-2'-O)-methyltransferase n=1 Tax=Candidatus Ozemobacter sibiricus TaxID=2268124 RepID=A0A367ZQZ1_9BACT|nr:MAG: tRNA (guanosine(18)-2'-O)-methyltransferase [Candidatus Ozemobacter sibiricus]